MKESIIFSIIVTVIVVGVIVVAIYSPGKGAYLEEVKGVGKWACAYETKEWFGETTTKCINLETTYD